MELIFELLFQIIGEFVLQFLFEGLFNQLFARSKSQPGASSVSGATVLGYMLAGAAAGALSLLIFPHLFIASSAFRIVNLFVTPLAAGLAMVAIGNWRERKGQERTALDRFWVAYLFALTMALTRFLIGK